MGAKKICALRPNCTYFFSSHNFEGLVGDNSYLISSLVSVNEILKEKAGAFPYLESPCASTIKLYQVLTADQDKDLHLVRDRNMKVKDKRR